MWIGSPEAWHAEKDIVKKIIDLALSDRVYDELRTALTEGRFRPGDRLIIDRLAAELGVSQTPVREAMKHLVAAGVLDARPNHSIVVPILSPEQYQEVADLRCALEGMAAARAIQSGSRQELKSLSSLQEKMDVARDWSDYATVLQLNRRFHFGIVEAARMPLLMHMVETLWMRSGPLMPLLENRGVYAKSSTRHPHRQFLRAFKAGAPEKGEQAMVTDIRNGTRIILAALQDLQARDSHSETG